ncbi:restriction endonuclease [Flavobacterium sp. UBA7663]|uniref:restriction endonuclease n=1 Tax=Flavobacterium sp. UBA7663 TaxID=1946557 RepID=UPI0025BA1CAF|nr:restriction endonuclease [Flavobacterium sp. UBA7663]
MKYKIEDISFEKISPKAFENLCYDLLVNYNFHNLIWRDGGGDNGRDIEANSNYSNPFTKIEQKWFFECKHYSAGVPPADLNSKIAWADAEQPNFLVFFISSYITTAARTWLEKISPQKNYKIILIEGPELKNRIVQYSDLVERYFSENHYEKLFKDIKDYKVKFNINPSYEVLKEIIENIDLDKLDIEDFGFIIFNFYDQYKAFEARNDHYGDFDGRIIMRVLAYLKKITINDKLTSFEEYKENYNELGGAGFLDEMYWLDDEEYEEEMENYDFQYYDLHLNHKKDQEFWNVGKYVFVIFEDSAFEIFKDKETEIRVLKEFNPEKLTNISLNLPNNIVENYKKYKEKFAS